MAGTYAGGSSLPFFQTLLAEGVPFLIAAGLEKLVPGDLLEVIPSAGRKKVDYSFGMAVGLIPIFGEIFTEVEALETLAAVKALVIGKGGIHGAEGSTTLLIEGPKKEVLKIEGIYRELKGAALSGDPRNLIPCATGSRSCGSHIRCLYKKGWQQIPKSEGPKFKKKCKIQILNSKVLRFWNTSTWCPLNFTGSERNRHAGGIPISKSFSEIPLKRCCE